MSHLSHPRKVRHFATFATFGAPHFYRPPPSAYRLLLTDHCPLGRLWQELAECLANYCLYWNATDEHRWTPTERKAKTPPASWKATCPLMPNPPGLPGRSQVRSFLSGPHAGASHRLRRARPGFSLSDLLAPCCSRARSEYPRRWPAPGRSEPEGEEGGHCTLRIKAYIAMSPFPSKARRRRPHGLAVIMMWYAR
jgi:hypothetical protein